jgi:hypothetical protein
MTFHINRFPTIGEIAELAGLAKNTPIEHRVLSMHLGEFRLAEDRQRNAFMFHTGPISRDTSSQAHLLMFFKGHWFDIRSKHWYSAEVCFYNFPAEMEPERRWIEQCFGQAARVYGWALGGSNDADIFDPVFGPDDWYGGGL